MDVTSTHLPPQDLTDTNTDTDTAYTNTHWYQGPSPFSDQTMTLISVIARVVVGGGLCVLGVAANVVNLLVFRSQGPMSSSPTVILTGLAVADLSVCLLGLVSSSYAIILTFVNYSSWSWQVDFFQAITCIRPMNLLTQITCWVTTFMAFERAVSVTFPFKVKAVFTPRRSLVVMVSIFLVLSFIHIPNLTDYKASRAVNPVTNASYWTMVPSHLLPQTLLTAYFILSPVVLRFSSVFFVVLCNAVIIWKVRSSQRFRHRSKSDSDSNARTINENVAATTTSSSSSSSSALQEDKENSSRVGKEPTSEGSNSVSYEDRVGKEASTSKGGNSSSSSSSKDVRDIRLLRMIVVVSTVFLVCYSTNIAYTIALNLVLVYHVDYHYTVEEMTFVIILIIQYFNSAINMLIYLTMSTRYQDHFRLVCCPTKTR